MRKNKYVMRKYKYRYEMRKGRGVADRDYRDLSGFLVSNQIPNPCFQIIQNILSLSKQLC